MITRALKGILLDKIHQREVIVLYGARRVGKTTLMEEIYKGLSGKKQFLNSENPSHFNLLSSQRFATYESAFSSLDYLMIDEAQVVPNVGKILKLLHDSFKNLKILVSGSASFDLANKIGEPLTGRQRTFTLYPISVMEEGNDEVIFNDRLPERLIYGSYPKVLNILSHEEKKEELYHLSSSYLYKDILMLSEIKNSEKIKDLLILLSLQIGSEVSLQELAQRLQLHVVTVQKYLDLLEKTFVIFKLRGFSRNLRKEVSKSCKYYFFDLGIRNAIISNFRGLELRDDTGALWENYLMSERKKQLMYHRKFVNMYFWRTYDQKEIDLIEEEDGFLRAFEFKWNERAKVKPPKLFLNTYTESEFEAVSPSNFIHSFLKVSH